MTIPDDYPPDHHQQSPRQRPSVHSQSRIPRPGFASSDRMPNQPGASHGRSPRRTPDPHQQYYASQNPAWETSQNLYDGSGYDYAQDYGPDDQWPLPVQPQTSSSPARGSPGPGSRRPPPQRPQRPDEQPQQPEHQQRILDPPRSTPHIAFANHHSRQPPPPAASHHGSGHWTGDSYSYAPPPNYPLPNRPQEGTLGLPSYPPPQGPQQAGYGRANQRPPLGPPPSARRGPAHYYPHVGPVQVIQEETESMRGSVRTGSAYTGGHDSKISFASSNAIPIGISQCHLNRGQQGLHQPLQRPELLSESEDDDYDDSPTEPAIARGDISSPEPGQVNRDQKVPSPEVMVVRQASLGKKSKPTLTTVTSSDRTRKSSGSTQNDVATPPSQQQSTIRAVAATPDADRMEMSRMRTQEALEGPAGAGAVNSVMDYDTRREFDDVTPPAQRSGSNPRSGQRTPEDILKSGTGFIDTSSDSESESVIQRQHSKELLGAELGNQLHPQRSQPRSPLAPAVDPRIESIIGSLEKGGALSPEEAKELKEPLGGSPERAGKRRPPRLDVDAVRNAEARGSLTSLPDLIRRATKLASNLDRGKTASRMGMNWFDGAEEGEKRRSGSVSDILASFPNPHNLATPTESRTGWRASRMRHSELASDSDAGEGKQRRRCCGMKLWVFVMLMLILFLLIAAAVVVPVVLIVLPKRDDHRNSSNQVGSCEKAFTCENGGMNIFSSRGSCECLCINGYTGRTCSTRDNTGCTTISTGFATDATVGEAIPRLFEGAQTNFSIPLDTRELLGLFSSSDMNCNTQNALVTFNGENRKRSLVGTPRLEERQYNPASSPAATSNGIVYASGTPTATSSASTATATATSSSTETTVLDFARVAVLYVFQTSTQLNIAADAQENLQDFLSDSQSSRSSSSNARNVISLGNGYSVNLATYSLSMANGTIVGGL